MNQQLSCKKKRATNPLLILSYVFPFVCPLKWSVLLLINSYFSSLHFNIFRPVTLACMHLSGLCLFCIIACRLPNITRPISTCQCKSDKEDAGGRNCIKDVRRGKQTERGTGLGRKGARVSHICRDPAALCLDALPAPNVQFVA